MFQSVLPEQSKIRILKLERQPSSQKQPYDAQTTFNQMLSFRQLEKLPLSLPRFCHKRTQD